jgi:hypothetical protein
MGEASKPEAEGDRIVGRVTSKRVANTRYGERPVVELDDGSTIWCGSTILKRDLYEAAEVGQRVDVSYEGERTSKAGNTYRAFSVLIDPE